MISIKRYFENLNAESTKIIQESKHLNEEEFKVFIAQYESIPVLWEALKSDEFNRKRGAIMNERITDLVSESLCEHSLNEERLLSQIDFYLMYLNDYIGNGYSSSVMYERIYNWFDLYLKMVKNISWLEDRRARAGVNKDLLELWETVMKREWIKFIRDYEDSEEETDNEWFLLWVEEPWRIPQFLVNALQES